MTTTALPPVTTVATDKTAIFERPADVSDGVWADLVKRAHRVITGHMPWCEEHYDDNEPDGGWCVAERTVGDVARVQLHNGSLSGMTQVCVEINNHEGTLTVAEAMSLSCAIDELSNAGHAGNAAIERPSEVEDR